MPNTLLFWKANLFVLLPFVCHILMSSWFRPPIEWLTGGSCSLDSAFTFKSLSSNWFLSMMMIILFYICIFFSRMLELHNEWYFRVIRKSWIVSSCFRCWIFRKWGCQIFHFHDLYISLFYRNKSSCVVKMPSGEFAHVYAEISVILEMLCCNFLC